MVLGLPPVEETALREGKRTVVACTATAAGLAVLLVAAGAYYGPQEERHTALLDAAFAFGWLLVLFLLAAAILLRIRLQRREAALQARARGAGMAARGQGTHAAWLFPGPPGLAILRYLALGALYVVGALFVMGGIGAVLESGREAPFYVVAWLMLLVVGGGLAIAIVALHRVGRRWASRPGAGTTVDGPTTPRQR